MRHRVLVLVAEAYGCGGGIAQFNRNLLYGLSRRSDLDVRALGLYGGNGVGEPPQLSWSAPLRGGKPGFVAAAVRESLFWRPHIVICGLIGLGSLSWVVARLSGARFWSIVHGWEAWSPGVWYDNLGLRRADLISAVSYHTRQRLLSWCPLEASRVCVLPNSVDLERFRPGPRPAELAARWGLTDHRILLTVGRLDSRDRYKGQDRVIQLLPELAERFGSIRYLIVGEGDDRRRLEEFAVHHGVRDRVVFTGRVDDEDLVGLYRLADLFVMPSTGEGFGIVFLEAMACGCPVIGGSGDGSVEALARGELGSLVDPKDPFALGEAIREQLSRGRSQDQRIAGVERFARAGFHERLDVLVDHLLAEDSSVR